MKDTLDKLYLCLRVLKSAYPKSRRARWYVLGPDGALLNGPFHAAELAYRIHSGLLEEDNIVFDAKAGIRYRVGDSPLLRTWLVRGDQETQRLVRGLLNCVRDYVREGNLPIDITLPAWSDQVQTPEERRAYQVLNLSSQCSSRDARRRHRELVLSHHPDHGGSEDKMKEINWAYEVVRRASGF